MLHKLNKLLPAFWSLSISYEDSFKLSISYKRVLSLNLKRSSIFATIFDGGI
jgi:hypothetical protein